MSIRGDGCRQFFDRHPLDFISLTPDTCMRPTMLNNFFVDYFSEQVECHEKHMEAGLGSSSGPQTGLLPEHGSVKFSGTSPRTLGFDCGKTALIQNYILVGQISEVVLPQPLLQINALVFRKANNDPANKVVPACFQSWDQIDEVAKAEGTFRVAFDSPGYYQVAGPGSSVHGCLAPERFPGYVTVLAAERASHMAAQTAQDAGTADTAGTANTAVGLLQG